MSALARLDGVWKAYPRYAGAEPTLRALVSRRIPAALRRGELRWALRDVDLAVEPGEAVAVIGHNGAGKSTLLRLAAGLGRPTRGAITTPPGTAALLSLGTALDAQLTGAENAATIAAVLGLSPAETRRAVPAALAFAELADFAEMPVRAYSDGMRLRLVFGVLAQVQPRLLIVDEALSVGDVAFQERCLERIDEMRERGAALLLASHDLHQVAATCDRAYWLQGGEVRASGAAAEVVGAYRESGRHETLARTPAAGDGDLGVRRWGSQELRIEELAVTGPGGEPARELPPGAPLSIEMRLEPAAGAIDDPQLTVELKRARDELVACSVSTAGGALRLGTVSGPARVALRLGRLDLEPGEYLVCAGAYPPDWSYAYDYRWDVARVRVSGGAGEGVLHPPARWERI